MCYICDMKRGIIIGIICLLSTVLYAQKVVVSGTVIDEQTGKRIPQASVSEVGSSVSVVTNDDGFFTIKLDGNAPVVTISHLGYQSRQVKIAIGQTQRGGGMDTRRSQAGGPCYSEDSAELQFATRALQLFLS